jgi:hypothetical protein
MSRRGESCITTGRRNAPLRALKPKCTPAKERRVKRWEHGAILDAMQERLDRVPRTMRIKRQSAEHRFGTVKAWAGATHFRLRTLEKVKTEIAFTFSPTT